MTSPVTFKHGYPFSKYPLVPSARITPYQRNPTTGDTKDPTTGGYYPIPTIWVNTATNAAYILTSNTGTSANWQGITDAATGNVVGPASSTDNALVRFDSTTGKLIQNSVGILSDLGIMTGVRPTLPAGTTAAGTAPMKFTTGINLTSPEAGAIEFDGSFLYYTNSVPTRLPLVAGPSVTVDNTIPRFDGTSGKLLQTGLGVISDTGVLTGLISIGLGIAPTAYLHLAAGTTAANTAPLKFTSGTNLTSPEAGAVEFDGTHLTYTNSVPTRKTIAQGPASSTDLALAKYTGTGGEIQNSATTLSAADVMTFPANGGPVLTAGTRKGTGSFTAGSSGAISTAAAVTGCGIIITRTNLAGAAAALGQYITINSGVSFTVTSGDPADTSSFNWHIIG